MVKVQSLSFALDRLRVSSLTLGGWGFNHGPGVVGSLHQPDFHNDCGTAIVDSKDCSLNPEYPSVEGLVKTMKPTFLPAGQKPAISVSMCGLVKERRERHQSLSRPCQLTVWSVSVCPPRRII